MGILRQKRPKSNSDSDFLAVAIEHAASGWSIIAVNGKRPRGLWKPFQERRADEPMLRKLFSKPGVTGLAVILGSASGGLACRDFDDAGTYHAWAAARPDLAATLPTVETARGYHVYFAGPEGYATLPDGEYRADSKHYCLLPPSLHPAGPVYRWLNPLTKAALLQLDPIQSGFLPQTEAEERRRTKAETQEDSRRLIHSSTHPLIACV